jgi:hypothetical protein
MTRVYCDKCKNEITETMELQEVYRIEHRGGYGSVFGDGNRVFIELCQQCLFDMLDEADLLNEDTITTNDWV